MAGKSEAKRFYLDTSAYLCILLNEPGATELARELEGSELLSSSLLMLEASRNLVRVARLGHLSAPELTLCLRRVGSDVELMLLKDLTLDLCLSRVVPLVSTPRSLDLAHLRTALWFHQQAPLTRFVSLDASQNQAAQELELPV